MTTRSLLPLQVNQPPVGLALPPSYRPDDVLIGPWSINAIGDELTGMAANSFAGAAWPAANRTIAYPFELADYFLIRKVWIAMGATIDASTLINVYNGDTLVRLLATNSGGVTANAVHEGDPTDVLLPPGRYLCTAGVNNNTNTPLTSATPVALLRAAGCSQMASLNADPWVPVAIASAYMPLFGIAGRTQVA